MTGQFGFSKWHLFRLRVGMFLRLLWEIIKITLVQPLLKTVLQKLLGRKLYKSLRDRFKQTNSPEIIDCYLRYNIIKYENAIYGIPQCLGPVDLTDKEQINRQEILKGKTFKQIINLINTLGPDEPELLDSYENYNIVKHKRIVYGIPQSLGKVDFTNEVHLNNSEILKAKTKEELIHIIKFRL